VKNKPGSKASKKENLEECDVPLTKKQTFKKSRSTRMVGLQKNKIEQGSKVSKKEKLEEYDAPVAKKQTLKKTRSTRLVGLQSNKIENKKEQKLATTVLKSKVRSKKEQKLVSQGLKNKVESKSEQTVVSQKEVKKTPKKKTKKSNIFRISSKSKKKQQPTSINEMKDIDSISGESQQSSSTYQMQDIDSSSDCKSSECQTLSNKKANSEEISMKPKGFFTNISFSQRVASLIEPLSYNKTTHNSNVNQTAIPLQEEAWGDEKKGLNNTEQEEEQIVKVENPTSLPKSGYIKSRESQSESLSTFSNPHNSKQSITGTVDKVIQSHEEGSEEDMSMKKTNVDSDLYGKGFLPNFNFSQTMASLIEPFSRNKNNNNIPRKFSDDQTSPSSLPKEVTGDKADLSERNQAKEKALTLEKVLSSNRLPKSECKGKISRKNSIKPRKSQEGNLSNISSLRNSKQDNSSNFSGEKQEKEQAITLEKGVSSNRIGYGGKISRTNSIKSRKSQEGNLSNVSSPRKSKQSMKKVTSFKGSPSDNSSDFSAKEQEKKQTVMLEKVLSSNRLPKSGYEGKLSRNPSIKSRKSQEGNLSNISTLRNSKQSMKQVTSFNESPSENSSDFIGKEQEKEQTVILEKVLSSNRPSKSGHEENISRNNSIKSRRSEEIRLSNMSFPCNSTQSMNKVTSFNIPPTDNSAYNKDNSITLEQDTLYPQWLSACLPTIKEKGIPQISSAGLKEISFMIKDKISQNGLFSKYSVFGSNVSKSNAPPPRSDFVRNDLSITSMNGLGTSDEKNSKTTSVKSKILLKEVTPTYSFSNNSVRPEINVESELSLEEVCSSYCSSNNFASSKISVKSELSLREVASSYSSSNNFTMSKTSVESQLSLKEASSSCSYSTNSTSPKLDVESELSLKEVASKCRSTSNSDSPSICRNFSLKEELSNIEKQISFQNQQTIVNSSSVGVGEIDPSLSASCEEKAVPDEIINSPVHSQEIDLPVLFRRSVSEKSYKSKENVNIPPLPILSESKSFNTTTTNTANVKESNDGISDNNNDVYASDFPFALHYLAIYLFRILRSNSTSDKACMDMVKSFCFDSTNKLLIQTKATTATNVGQNSDTDETLQIDENSELPNLPHDLSKVLHDAIILSQTLDDGQDDESYVTALSNNNNCKEIESRLRDTLLSNTDFLKRLIELEKAGGWMSSKSDIWNLCVSLKLKNYNFLAPPDTEM